METLRECFDNLDNLDNQAKNAGYQRYLDNQPAYQGYQPYQGSHTPTGPLFRVKFLLEC